MNASEAAIWDEMIDWVPWLLTGKLWLIAGLLAASALWLRRGHNQLQQELSTCQNMWEAEVHALLSGQWSPPRSIPRHLICDYLIFLQGYAKQLIDADRSMVLALGARQLPRLISEVPQRMPETRALKLSLISWFGGREAIPHLSAALADPSPLVASVAAGGLAQWLHHSDPAHGAQLSEAESRALMDTLLAHYERFAGWGQDAHISLFCAIGPKVVPWLTWRLMDGNSPPWLRAAATRALARMHVLEACTCAEQLLWQADTLPVELTLGSIELLSEIGDAEHLPLLEYLIQQNLHGEISAEAAKAIAHLAQDDQTGRDTLERLVQAKDPVVARFAAKGLVRLGHLLPLQALQTLPGQQGMLADEALRGTP